MNDFGQYFLALALIYTDPESLPVNNYRAISPVIQDLAIKREILDTREIRYILTRPEDFQTDLKLLRNRNKELSEAPYVFEADRLPPRSFISEHLTMNRFTRSRLDDMLIWDLQYLGKYREIINELDQLYKIWDLARDARCDYYYITVRRNALKAFRSSIGERDYYNCNFPPFVPIGRYNGY